jgi:cholesterol transport system auxiliary component
VGGCAFGPSARPPSTLHDFGLLAEQPVRALRLQALLAVPDPSAPGWLDTTSMLYRLAYVDGGQPRVYSLSLWAAPPGELIGARLRSRLARIVEPGLASSRDGVAGEYVVRIELEEFSQVFDGPSTSRGVLRARATLIGGARRTTLSQRAFAFERPASSADAAGGAAALAAAGNDLVEAVIDWLAAEVPRKALVPG